MTKLIFEKSCQSRRSKTHSPNQEVKINISAKFLRKSSLDLPQVSELEVVRHYTKLSQKNFSVDTHFYPLGSCTMKYNPHVLQRIASLFALSNSSSEQHPCLPQDSMQGFMQCLYELQEYLKEITGFCGVSLTPSAGAHGEFAGIAMIHAYHKSRNDERSEIIVPDAAHGTNPASAAMGNYLVREVSTLPSGDLDLAMLKKIAGPKTAGIMLTNPSTLGVFERNILEIAKIIHGVGGLLYYDGANLNAILGKARPGDMQFDVMHMNLHKTFGTPHGGGGPGAGPVAVNSKLLPFLPTPIVAKSDNKYIWITSKEHPQTIGKLSAFFGNAGILLRAYIYIRLLGKEGLKRVGEYSTLNANYFLKVLQSVGIEIPYKDRRASHEFIATFKNETKNFGVTAKDIGKRLLDYGFHAPTTYFPLLVPECFLIEPTETESKQEIDEFAKGLLKILEEIKTNPELVRNAPYAMSIKRLDETKAAKDMDFAWGQ